ncbi:hypothetical protein TDIS_0195 [Thermosulfurimonas dismutans]|uniref:HD-GYP domain-containing protein n=1 Tax=Thermosulfurimonas dismutans TaxID=999894 RepID=A0A179D6K8_9BACT|nr:hypothetical protein TDIS_0195 [Thermosulfurimonas dismutans]
MTEAFLFPLESIVFALSEALDSAAPHLVNHQLKVSYIVRMLGKKLGIGGRELESLVIAGALHDIALFTTKEKAWAFEDEPRIIERHTRLGYRMLREFPYLKRAAEFVLYHHTPWEELKSETDYNTALASNIIYLADRLEVRTRDLRPILLHSGAILEEFQLQKSRFAPEIREALAEIAEKELFWLRLERFKKETELILQLQFSTYLPCEDLSSLASLFSVVIDLRSPFTRVHSAGVAWVAKWLGEVLGFSQNLLENLKVAGYLHDIGKLSVPEEILDKPGPLTPEEWAIMKAHPFVTYRILEKIPYFETITAWASSHHERLDGKGYPAKLSAGDLSLGARVLAVADVTTAILEDRPYRTGMPLTRARDVLKNLSGKALDSQIVKLVIENLDHVREIITQVRAKRYERFEAWGHIPEG